MSLYFWEGHMLVILQIKELNFVLAQVKNPENHFLVVCKKNLQWIWNTTTEANLSTLLTIACF